MAANKIEDLFYNNRIPEGAPLILFLLYLPIGVLLCVIRILFCVQLVIILTILPKGNLVRQWILRICGCILGIVVSSKSEGSLKSKPKILVSNSISELDSLVIEFIEPHLLVSKASSLPSFISWLMGYQKYENSKTNLQKNLSECVSRTDMDFPALIFPEESTTNGQISLLKFSNSYFQLPEVYQPVVLTATRPSLLPVKLTVLTGGFWSDLLWTFFVPYTACEIRYLPPMEKLESSSVEDFAKCVCKEMSDSLGLTSAQFDAGEKREYIKRIQHIQPEVFQKRSSAARQSPMNSKLESMVRQVKDVLPQVPSDVIRRDLVKSKAVNVTLTNLLEGRILYIPLTKEESEAERIQEEKKRAEIMKKSTPDMAAPVNKKGLSFEEKKKLMIEEARRKYLEKHPEFSY